MIKFYFQINFLVRLKNLDLNDTFQIILYLWTELNSFPKVYCKYLNDIIISLVWMEKIKKKSIYFKTDRSKVFSLKNHELLTKAMLFPTFIFVRRWLAMKNCLLNVINVVCMSKKNLKICTLTCKLSTKHLKDVQRPLIHSLMQMEFAKKGIFWNMLKMQIYFFEHQKTTTN